MNRIHLLIILLCVGLAINLIFFISRENSASTKSIIESSEEPILSFDSELRITPNDLVIVTEQIKVQGAGKKFQRGIIRPLPITILNSKSERLYLTYKMISLSRNGQQIPSLEPTAKGNSMLYYLGENDKILAPGIYDYFFQYEANGIIEKLPDMKKIFHDLTGDSQFPVYASSVSIRIPEKLRREHVVMKGKIVSPIRKEDDPESGTTNIEGDFSLDDGSIDPASRDTPIISFRAPRALNPHERLFIEVTWSAY